MRSSTVVIAIVLGFCLAAVGDAGETHGDFAPGEILVRLQAGADAADAECVRAAYGAAFVRTLLSGKVELWKVSAGLEMATCDLLSTEPGVQWAEPNFIYHASATVPDDPAFGNQWGHARISSTAAWDIETGSDRIVIAIIDSGIDPGHPDLAAKTVAGYDFVGNDTDPTDLNGHGTHVAGVAAGITDNGVGVAGMSWGARIMPVRVLDTYGSGYNSDITDGITWAVANGADILNLSLGGPTFSQAMQDEVNAAHAAGRLVVAAMGNDRTNNPTDYPAACDNVFAVAATNRYDNYAPYSQYGSHCDIAAPGGEMSYLHDSNGVYSTMPTYSCYYHTQWGYSLSYDYLRGTSQAAPFVSGLAALVWSRAGGLSPDDVQVLIENTATDRGPAGWDEDYGWGLIDAEAALLATDHIFSDGFETGDMSAW